MSGWKHKSGLRASRAGRGGAALAGDLIGSGLRQCFEEVALAPLPDKFLQLLAQLEAREAEAREAEAREAEPREAAGGEGPMPTGDPGSTRKDQGRDNGR